MFSVFSGWPRETGGSGTLYVQDSETHGQWRMCWGPWTRTVRRQNNKIKGTSTRKQQLASATQGQELCNTTLPYITAENSISVVIQVSTTLFDPCQCDLWWCWWKSLRVPGSAVPFVPTGGCLWDHRILFSLERKMHWQGFSILYRWNCWPWESNVL